jgi:hypothetical protein
MRSHGVPNFPDPDSHGGISITAGPGGLNPDSPKFQAAQKACEKLMPAANASPAQQAQAQAQMLRYSACMRSHGLAKFPDPQFSGGRGSLKLDSSSGLNPNSAQFKAAQKACQKMLPGRPTGGPGGTTGKGSTGGGPTGGASLQTNTP